MGEDDCGHYEIEHATFHGLIHNTLHEVAGEPNTTAGRIVDGVLAVGAGYLLRTAIFNKSIAGRLARWVIYADVASVAIMHTFQVGQQCESSESSLGKNPEMENDEKMA